MQRTRQGLKWRGPRTEPSVDWAGLVVDSFDEKRNAEHIRKKNELLRGEKESSALGHRHHTKLTCRT